MNVSTSSTEAHYQGFSTEAHLLLPLLDTKKFSMDLDLGYRATNYENSASTPGLAEWASLKGLSTGFRFHFKYFFFGTDMSFLNGKHLISGTTSEINDYKINPIQAHAGIHIPVSPVLALALSYSNSVVKGKATVSSQDISVNEQLIMLRLQIDLGLGFFNAVSPKDSFQLSDDPAFY